MWDFLLDLIPALLWIGGGILISLGVPTIVRHLFRPPSDQLGPDGYRHIQSTRDLGQMVGLRAAALYGIILGLVYAQELGGIDKVQDGFAEEAVLVSDVWYDAGCYGGPSAPVIRAAMKEYAQVVAGPEWKLLATDRRLSDKGWIAREGALQAVLNLVPANPREQSLRGQMLSHLTEIARFRQIRGEAARLRSATVFWIPAIAGLALVSMPFFVFPPTRANRLLIASFGAFAGLILYLIAAFSNPFGHPFRVQPEPFTALLEHDMAVAP